MAAASGKLLGLRAWDGYWRLGIAERVYLGAAQGMTDAHRNRSPDGAMAFFPSYPLALGRSPPCSGTRIPRRRWLSPPWPCGLRLRCRASRGQIVGAVWLLAWSWRRLPWRLSVYCLLVLALAFESRGLVHDRLRLLLSAFPVLLPLASSFAAAGRQRRVVATGVFVPAGLWVGANGFTVWGYSI